MKTDLPYIPTINGGPSSIKFALFEAGETLLRIVQGEIEQHSGRDALAASG